MKFSECPTFIPADTLETTLCQQRLYFLLKGALHCSNTPAIFYRAEASRLFLFTGITGSGKHTMQEAFAGSAKEAGYLLKKISVNKLIGNNSYDTLNMINELFDTMEEQFEKCQQNIFLSLEDICLLNDDTHAMIRFFSRLKALRSYKNMHIISAGVYDDAQGIPKYFRSAAHIISIELPDTDLREKYFEYYFEDFLVSDNGITSNFLAEITDGYTFGELSALADEIVMYIKGKNLYNVSEETTWEFPDICSTSVITINDIELFASTIRKNKEKQNSKSTMHSIFNYPHIQLLQALPAMVQTVTAESHTKSESVQNILSADEVLKITSDASEAENLNQIADPELSATRELPSFF